MDYQKIKRLVQKRKSSFGFAINGIWDLFKTQVNAQIHAFFTVLVVFGGFFFNISKVEWLLCIISIAMVLAAEAINTALEYVVDLVSPEFHELAGKSKGCCCCCRSDISNSGGNSWFQCFLETVCQFILKVKCESYVHTSLSENLSHFIIRL